jgi:uncharacterized membrane protein
VEHRKEDQESGEESPEMESGEVEAGNTEAEDADTKHSTPLGGSNDEWEATFSREEDWTDSAGSGEGPEPTPAEQFADSARTQAGAAADALRRGEFMHGAAVDTSADGDDRLIALLCYVTQMLIPLVMPILVLLSASSKKRPFQRFHATQSLALSITFILFGLLMSAGSTILAFVPVIGWLVVMVVFCLGPLLALMAFLALAYYGYQAYQGKRFAVPGLTSLLQDQGWI